MTKLNCKFADKNIVHITNNSKKEKKKKISNLNFLFIQRLSQKPFFR